MLTDVKVQGRQLSGLRTSHNAIESEDHQSAIYYWRLTPAQLITIHLLDGCDNDFHAAGEEVLKLARNIRSMTAASAQFNIRSKTRRNGYGT